jgi:hypothetical protein
VTETTTFDPAEVRDRLQQRWESEPFPRLADTLLDQGVPTDNPYWDVVRLMPREKDPWMDPWVVDWMRPPYEPTRTDLVNTYAWSIPSPADLEWMRGILLGRGVVEIGAGSGYWAYQLRQLGVDVVAVDNGEWSDKWCQHWSLVVEGDTRIAEEHPDRALILIWPPYDSPMARTALDFYDGDLLIYAGEGDGGCTADDSFHEALTAEWEQVGEAPHHPTFDGIHCRLTAYRRAADAQAAIERENQ